MDRKDLQNLSKVRLKEAQALLELELFDGAYYLAGYAVECALKACIAKGTQRFEFPDKKRAVSSYTHSLPDLLKIAGLDEALKEYANANDGFRANWISVVLWSEDSRYRRNLPDDARQILHAVSDRRHGVIAWIKRQW